MNNILTLLNGNKTYIACALGALVVIANHFGIQVVGVQLDPTNWINELWQLALVASGRSAIAKVG